MVKLATAIRFHIRYVTRDEEGASISTAELRGLTGDLRDRHLATRDGYERKFRELLKGGIGAGAFAPVDVRAITAGILGIGLNVGRWYPRNPLPQKTRATAAPRPVCPMRGGSAPCT